MKKTVYGVLLGVSAGLMLLGCERAAIAEDQSPENNDNKAAIIPLEDDIAKASYLLGNSQAAQLQNQTAGVLDARAFTAGVSDALNGQANRVGTEDAEALLQAFQTAIAAKQQEAYAGETASGDAFRSEFAKQPGVVSLPSGLLYQVMVDSEGPKPALTDTVTTHYHGTLTSGEVFDSSVQRDQPASFPVNGVIKGWTEALQLMSVGSKWKLVIPPDLAYGARGAGGSIPPQATLVFEVELLAIN